jgi:predicted oxidoreductase
VHQIELLRRYVDQPLIANQLELNLLYSHLINDGVVANQEENHYAGAGGILDYCRLKDILVQAWAPVAGGWLLDPPPDAPQRARATAEVVARLAREHNTTREAIVLAWLLRHPARIQPIIGTTRPDRITASSAADEITLSREEWFDLFVAARGAEMP